MATADNHQHIPPCVCLEYKWRQDMEIGLWRIAYGERETWREGKKEGARKEGKPRSYSSGDTSDMYIEHVCFSVSTCVYCVIFPHCERIDAVHADPAGRTHSCKLKMFFFFSLPAASSVRCSLTAYERMTQKITQSGWWMCVSSQHISELRHFPHGLMTCRKVTCCTAGTISHVFFPLLVCLLTAYIQ